ncbi:MAG: hypothetical protein C0412_12510, partial [Flavobacterium sp.]|nr:hypothetical protein [Flavobacterium sp.]
MFFPEIALLEAFRVLKKGGTITVGMFIHGGEAVKLTHKEKLKSIIQKFGIISNILINDHHIWRPTFAELKKLVESAGFKIKKSHWQEGIRNVCYIHAEK